MPWAPASAVAAAASAGRVSTASAGSSDTGAAAASINGNRKDIGDSGSNLNVRDQPLGQRSRSETGGGQAGHAHLRADQHPVAPGNLLADQQARGPASGQDHTGLQLVVEVRRLQEV